jgi:hypothetical protein
MCAREGSAASRRCAAACASAAEIPLTKILVLWCMVYGVCVCVFITAGPSTKLFTWGGGGIWEDMCYERRRAEYGGIFFWIF